MYSFALKRFCILSILTASLIPVASCAKKPPVTDRVTETIKAIDAYRATDGLRKIDKSVSTDATFKTLGDRVTTAGVQFSGPIARITLTDVLLTTLKNNYQIQIEDYNRSIADDAIESAKGIYDLLLAASYDYNRTKQQGAFRVDPDSEHNGLTVSKTKQQNGSVSLQQLLPTGGTLSLFATDLWQKDLSASVQAAPGIDVTPGTGAINPFNSVAFGASIVQPLLRNFGPYVTNAPIRIAQLNSNVELETFRGELITDLSGAVKSYWDLVFAINNYEVQVVSLERANELLRIAVIKRDTGVEPPNTVLQAQAEVASRESNVIAARATIANAEDLLKRIMHISNKTDEWHYNLIPADSPTYTPYNLNEEAIYTEALKFRPDYRAALLNKDIATINKRVAHNQRLPQLNLVGTYQLTGTENHLEEASENAGTGDYNTYDVGARFSFPLQNRTARANYRQAVTREEQAGTQIASIMDLIRLDVRVSIRAMDTGLKLIDAYDSLVKADEAKLDSQRKRYEVGFATIFEVIQFQEDLANAQVSYLQAVVNYNKALVDLQRAKASFLEDYSVEILQSPFKQMEAETKAADAKKEAAKPSENLPKMDANTKAETAPKPVPAPAP